MGGRKYWRASGSSSNSKGRGSGRGRGRDGFSFEMKEERFVDGGVLSDWQFNTPPLSKPFSRGGRRDSSGSKGGSFEGYRRQVSFIGCRGANVGGNRTINALKVGILDGSGSSGSKMVQSKGHGRTYGYQYPSLKLQEGFLQEPSVEVNEEYDVGDSQNFSLCGSKETKITVYKDEMPPSISHVPYVTYDCSYNFVLGDNSHRGLGFEEDVVVGEGSSEQMALIGETEFDRSASDIPRDKGEGSSGSFELKKEESQSKKLSSKNEPAFLSIGGIKLYTEDISDEEKYDDEFSNEESLESEMSDGEESVQSSENDDFNDIFDSRSSIDEDVVNDYMEGVGGCGTLLDAANLLVEEISIDSDDSSTDDIRGAMEKLGGIALQEASMEYGMQKNFHSSLKDSRTLISKKIRHNQLPQSWPSKSQSKRLRNYPGEKKKLRKKAIAAKRRTRMMLRGVDLEQINMKLEQIVLEGVDIYSFQPMHPRDCSQVQRLASIYRLQSSFSNGSGKKRFVTVARSQHTSLPSSSDKVRLEKLIGPGDDADYPVVDIGHTKSSGGRKQTKRTPTGSNSRPQERTLGSRRNSSKNSANRSRGGEKGEGRGKKAPLANQPVSFISSGVIQSETAAEEPLPASSGTKNVNREDHRSARTCEKFAAFEVHTKGFGSKMMARMGFVEGQGLGRTGDGMAAPIQVIQRPRSLGLGMNF